MGSQSSAVLFYRRTFFWSLFREKKRYEDVVGTLRSTSELQGTPFLPKHLEDEVLHFHLKRSYISRPIHARPGMGGAGLNNRRSDTDRYSEGGEGK